MAARADGLSGPAGAYAAAAVICVGGLATAWTLGRAVAADRDADFRRGAAATGQTFDAAARDVERSVRALDALGAGLDAQPVLAAALFSPDRVAGVVTTRPPAGLGEVRELAGEPGDLGAVTRAVRASAAQLEVARDSGEPYVGTPVADLVTVVIPVYGPAGEPATAPERRARLTSWHAAVVDLRQLAGSLGAGGQDASLRVRGAGPGTASSRPGVERSATVAGVPWVLTITPPESGVPPVSWVTAGVALVAAAGVALAGRRTARRLATASAAATTLARETRTVADIGPLLQRSLDLAEVLPAVAVRLCDEFDLARLGVQLLNERGDLVDVFAVGGRAGEVADLTLGPVRATVAPGDDVAFPLVRAGRTIGRLRLAGRRELVASRLDSLRAAADLIAVATYNVEMYEREQANVRRLQEVDRLKDAFLGTISHELRTPITAIGGFVRLLTDRWDELSDEQRRDFLDRLARNASSLGLLVDELLDFARLERQALSVAVTPLDLTDKVGRTVAQLVPLLGRHEVTVDLAPGTTALADPNAVERILANLLTNAAKYSPDGSRIEVAVHGDGRFAEVTVADRGPGIAAEDRLRVFTTFYRGNSDAARATRGAGIGLAVVRELVHQMGGTIDVRDNEPHGTRMVVRLPAVAEPPAAGPVVPRQRAAAETGDVPLRSES